MKNTELEAKIKEAEDLKKNASAQYSPEKALNELNALNKIYIRLLNDFNNSTSRYNKWLIGLTIVIGILTTLMLFKRP